MSERLARLRFGDDWRAAGEPTTDVMDVRPPMDILTARLRGPAR
jgi:hypothetical protein